MKTRNTKLNILLLIVLMSYAIVYFLEIIKFPYFEQRITITILFIAFSFFCVLEIIANLISLSKNKKDGKVKEEKVFNISFKKLLYDKKILLTLLLIFYAVLIPFLGFFTTSFIFLVLTLYMLGTRNYYLVFGLPIGLVLCFYYCFVVLLKVRIPTGVFY